MMRMLKLYWHEACVKYYGYKAKKNVSDTGKYLCYTCKMLKHINKMIAI